MTPVQLFKAVDGQIFDTPEKAVHYEAVLALKTRMIAELGEVNLPSGPALDWLVNNYQAIVVS